MREFTTLSTFINLSVRPASFSSSCIIWNSYSSPKSSDPLALSLSKLKYLSLALLRFPSNSVLIRSKAIELLTLSGCCGYFYFTL